MTSAPQYIELHVDLTEEERALVEARAKMLGFDVETFFRVRALTSEDLPEPCAFLEIVSRLQNFAADYRAHMHAIAERHPDVDRQSKTLGASFAKLLQDWDALYGPR
jgi:hypothetical protein